MDNWLDAAAEFLRVVDAMPPGIEKLGPQAAAALIQDRDRQAIQRAKALVEGALRHRSLLCNACLVPAAVDLGKCWHCAAINLLMDAVAVIENLAAGSDGEAILHSRSQLVEVARAAMEKLNPAVSAHAESIKARLAPAVLADLQARIAQMQAATAGGQQVDPPPPPPEPSIIVDPAAPPPNAARPALVIP
jgi:hypothetical protein